MADNLTSLQGKLNITYRSGRDDVVQDFYLPCLEKSILYRRAVGYFTSSGLAFAARGVASLVKRKGRMKLISSPLLEESDLEALRLGTEKPEEVLRRVAIREMSEIEDLLSRERLNALAWLIANNSLEIRLAIRINENEQPSRGIYHEKIGIFTDEMGNDVAFSGSSNETAGGLFNNFESIDVYWSWEDTQGRVQQKIDDFEALWENKTRGVRVYEFTAISRELLSRYKLSKPPRFEEEPDKDYAPSNSPIEPGTIPSRLEIRDYQKLGLEKWKKAGGKGILAMATGTGKTLTALYLACRLYEKANRLVVVVVCPYVNLARQWVDEMKKFGLDPVCCFRSRSEWDDHAFNVERRLFQRELRRILEFCETAENGPAALHELHGLRKRYNLLAEELN